MSEQQKDWRIGLSCKPKFRGHSMYYESCTIVNVLPSGTRGLHDPNGILVIQTSGGLTLLDCADNWMTA